MTLKDAEASLAQLAAEKTSPKHDVWYAGTGDWHQQAADAGLTDEYRSPLLPQLHDWAVRQAEQSKWHAVGALCRCARHRLQQPSRSRTKQLPEPRCWADLAQPEYRGRRCRCANPNSSRTGVRDARDARAGLRRGQGVRAAERRCIGTSANYPRTGGGRDTRGGAGRDDDRGHVAARRRDGNRQRISDQARRRPAKAPATRSAR